MRWFASLSLPLNKDDPELPIVMQRRQGLQHFLETALLHWNPEAGLLVFTTEHGRLLRNYIDFCVIEVLQFRMH
jgi:hypothetical protein